MFYQNYIYLFFWYVVFLFFSNSISDKFSGIYGVEELCDKGTQVQRQSNTHTIWFMFSILLQTMMMGFVMNILIHTSFQHVRSPVVSFFFFHIFSVLKTGVSSWENSHEDTSLFEYVFNVWYVMIVHIIWLKVFLIC